MGGMNFGAHLRDLANNEGINSQSIEDLIDVGVEEANKEQIKIGSAIARCLNLKGRTWAEEKLRIRRLLFIALASSLNVDTTKAYDITMAEISEKLENNFTTTEFLRNSFKSSFVENNPFLVLNETSTSVTIVVSSTVVADNMNTHLSNLDNNLSRKTPEYVYTLEDDLETLLEVFLEASDESNPDNLPVALDRLPIKDEYNIEKFDFDPDRVDPFEDSISEIIEWDEDPDEDEEEEEEITPDELEGSDSPVPKLVNQIIVSAIKKRASDIHFRPKIKPVSKKLVYMVEFRIDGEIIPQHEIPVKIAPKIVSRIKVMAHQDIAEKIGPQDGGFNLKFGKGKSYSVRASFLPSLHKGSENIVLRILDPSNLISSISDFNLPIEIELELRKVLTYVQGLVLVTGPTGSGKSTTLFSLIQEIAKKGGKNIITIEDPVEYQIPGISQVQANPPKLGFNEGLRSILRQDPDVIMVGELRDEETVNIAFKSAQTGHLVFSTLHTNSSAETITRLSDMGVPDYSVAETTKAVISQRLVRRLCENCKDLNDTLNPKATGCQYCNHTGYKGRVGVYEIMHIGPSIKSAIRDKLPIEEVEGSATVDNPDFKLLWESGKALVEQGITTMDEVRTKVGIREDF